MLVEDFLPITEVREKCAVGNSSADDLLTRHRAAAIAHVEKITQRNILDRSVTVMCLPEYTQAQRRFSNLPILPGPGQPVVFGVPDAKEIGLEGLSIEYRTKSETAGYNRDGRIVVAADQIDVTQSRVYAIQDTWPEADPSIAWRAVFSVGIVAGKAPPEFQTAVLFLVREMYFGSMLDQLKGGVVEAILRDHIAISFDDLDSDFLAAGVNR